MELHIEMDFFPFSWNTCEFKEMYLAMNNLEKLVIVNKKWHNDYRDIGCNSHFNLMIETKSGQTKKKNYNTLKIHLNGKKLWKYVWIFLGNFEQNFQ
jgi:hypothetical protein